MAKQEIKLIKLKIDLEGLKEFKSLSREIVKLDKSTKKGSVAIKSLAKSIQQVTEFTPKTISQFRQKEKVLKKLREEVRINGRGFGILGKAIDENRAKLQAFNQTAKKTPKGIGVGGKAALGAAVGGAASRFLPAGATTGAFAAIGAGAGPAGIATGALIGLTVDASAAFVQAGKSAAQYSASIKRLEVALRGVTKTQKEFAKAQEIIRDVSQELNVPIADASKQFTTLAASVIGAGGNVNDAELVFRGVSEAIKATGGDAEDVKSAIRAMSQIFGKGKVSAEELQGQLGERLPGAVTKFALATNRTLPQLQKDLRDGVVGLNSVMKFVVRLSEDHRDAALEMASSSAEAGARMRVTFDELKKNVGDILQPLGASIQDMTEIAINNLNRFIKGFKKFMKIGDEFKRETMQRRINQLEKLLGKRDATDLLTIASSPLLFSIMEANKALMSDEDRNRNKNELNFLKEQVRLLDLRNKTLKDFGNIMKNPFNFNIDTSSFDISGSRLNLEGFNNPFAQEGDGLTDFQSPMEKAAEEDTKKAREILDKYRDSVKDVNQQVANSFVSTFKKLEDALVQFVQTGTLNFKKLAQSIIADIIRIQIRANIIAPLTGGLSNLFRPKPSLGSTSFRTDLGGALTSFGDFNPSTTSFIKNPFKNANGNVFAKNKIVPYKLGGIIDSPRIFPMENGIGLMGEAGPESVMPLKRGKDGKLGVIAHGGGVGNIIVNVDASGSSVEGDEEQSQEFGELLGSVIRSTIIDEQRPGGLLNS